MDWLLNNNFLDEKDMNLKTKVKLTNNNKKKCKKCKLEEKIKMARLVKPF